MAREPLVVPGSVPLTKLLRDFQTRRIHLAIVVDEYGGTDGLVTLEDLIEELVGDISDEYDARSTEIVELEPGRYRLSARVALDEGALVVNSSQNGGAKDTWVLP